MDVRRTVDVRGPVHTVEQGNLQTPIALLDGRWNSRGGRWYAQKMLHLMGFHRLAAAKYTLPAPQADTGTNEFHRHKLKHGQITAPAPQRTWTNPIFYRHPKNLDKSRISPAPQKTWTNYAIPHTQKTWTNYAIPHTQKTSE
ncbi:hypothetical protein NG798_25260 [Ancylothrix sp. C2]|nr:hypothetical protein [Ancylothrix sp. D3o]